MSKKKNPSVVPPKPKKQGLRILTPKQLTPGYTIKGIYLFTETDVGNYGGEAYIIDPKDETGLYIQLFSCSSLKYKMKYVNPLEIIEIKYLGQLDPDETQEHGSYQFDVNYFNPYE